MNKESKKFILIIFKYFPYGGAQRDLLQLAKKLCKKNFVEIVCMDWDGTHPKEKNISVKLIESNYFFNYKRYSEFKKKLIMKTLLNIIQSVLAAFIGIQKNSKFDDDDQFIEKNGFLPYLLVGLFLALIFILLIVTVVSIILD